jgi:hypothetical protein
MSASSGGGKRKSVVLEELLKAPVSYYRGVDPKNREGEPQLGEVLELIRTRQVPKQLSIKKLKRRLRGLQKGTAEYETVKKQIENLKKGLFGFTPSCVCLDGRTDRGATSYNGVVIADFDLESEADVEKVVDLLRKDPHVLAAWRSVSGFGVTALLAGPPEPQLHPASFAAATERMLKLTGHKIDEKCKNIARLVFMPNDPHLYVNRNGLVRMEVAKGKPKAPEPSPAGPAIRPSVAKLERLKAACEKKLHNQRIEWTTVDGEVAGKIHCPDPERRHKEATLYLTDTKGRAGGLPHLHCHHKLCDEWVAAFNEWLRATYTEMYFDHHREKFWLTEADEKTWMMLASSGARSELIRLGIDRKLHDQILHSVKRHYNVQYSAPLAGYAVGIYTMFGKKILVTDSPILLQPARGPWPIMKRFLTNLFGSDLKQLHVFYGWLRCAYESVRTGQPSQSQALVVAGPPSAGKSLAQALITEGLGGRVAHPYHFMSGATDFNAELFGAEHLSIEDEKPSTDYASRRAFGTSLKNILTAQQQWCHRKHATPISLRPVWRLSISVNDDGEALQVLPSMDGDIADKVILLSVAKCPMPMPTGTLAEKKAFWETLLSELPAFLYYVLHVWEPPIWLLEGEEAQRYGIVSYKHPDLLEALGELAPETRVFDWINQIWFTQSEDLTIKTRQMRTIEQSAAEIENDIRKHFADRSWEINRVLKGERSMSTYLARLARKYPDRVRQKKAHGGIRRWVLSPPPKPYPPKPF